LAKQDTIFEKVSSRVGEEYKWDLKKEKAEISNKLEELDKKDEITMLSPRELDVKHCLNMRLMQLLREEEIKWY
jgi:hypothetical protein